ncbi:hypothetical protein Sjap_021781 [Stephania japonica]|uniref:Uncharacterized protein n=1 Tax=Stephania japonica TaxID=461633 RepID=A0AAP0HS21_9MAGN
MSVPITFAFSRTNALLFADTCRANALHQHDTAHPLAQSQLDIMVSSSSRRNNIATSNYKKKAAKTSVAMSAYHTLSV